MVDYQEPASYPDAIMTSPRVTERAGNGRERVGNEGEGGKQEKGGKEGEEENLVQRLETKNNTTSL